jgi:hypothetical protein
MLKVQEGEKMRSKYPITKRLHTTTDPETSGVLKILKEILSEVAELRVLIESLTEEGRMKTITVSQFWADTVKASRSNRGG